MKQLNSANIIAFHELWGARCLVYGITQEIEAIRPTAETQGPEAVKENCLELAKVLDFAADRLRTIVDEPVRDEAKDQETANIPFGKGIVVYYDTDLVERRNDTLLDRITSLILLELRGTSAYPINKNSISSKE